MKRTLAIVTIAGEQYEYRLEGRRNDWYWRCPGGERAGEAAGGATKTAALQNLAINLENDEPEYEDIRWA